MKQLRAQKKQIEELNFKLEKAQLASKMNDSRSKNNASEGSREGTPSPLMQQQQ